MRSGWLALLAVVALGAGGGWLALRGPGAAEEGRAAARDPLAPLDDVGSAGRATAPSAGADAARAMAGGVRDGAGGPAAADAGDAPPEADDPGPLADTILGFVADGDMHLLSGVPVTVSCEGEAARTVKTDDTGYFEIAGLAPGPWLVSTETPGLPPWAGTAEPGGGGLMIRLLDAMTIDVAVPNSPGDPMEVATAAVSRRHARGFETAPEPVELEADPALVDGAWRFRLRVRATAQAPHGPRRVWVRTADGRVGASDWVTPAGREKRAEATVAMAAGRTVRGVVVTPDGEPVPGAAVWLRALPGAGQSLGAALAAGSGSREPAGRSDEDGRFAVRVPSDGRFELLVTERSHESAVVALPTDDTELRVVLPSEPNDEQRRLTGVVLDPEGRPLAGVWLHFEGPEGWRGELPDISAYMTDADGRFTDKTWIPPGRYAVHVQQDGFLLGTVPASVGVEREVALELRLDRVRPSVDLRLRCVANGLPVVAAEVTVRVWPTPDDWDAARARTDADGRATVHISPGTEFIVHVQPRASEVGDEYLPAVRRVRLNPISGELLVALDAGHSLAGTLLDHDGAPLDVWWLQLLLDGPAGRNVRATQVAIVGLDSEQPGRFKIDGLGDGRYWIVTRREAQNQPPQPVRFGPIEVGDSDVEVTLRREVPGDVEGRVTDTEGRPVFGAAIVARWPGWDDDLAAADSAPDGCFRLASVPAGPIELHVTLGDAPPRVVRLDVPPGGHLWQDVALR